MMEQTSSIKKEIGYVSPLAVIVLFMVAIFLGYMYGWYVNSENNALSFIIALFIAYGARLPISMWKSYVLNLAIEADKEKESETITKMKRKQELEKEKIKIEKRLKKQFEKERKKEEKGKMKGDFTIDDFDDHAKHLIGNIVKEARKNKMKVTGHGLISSVLSQIR